MKTLPRIVAEHDINSKVTIKYWRDSKQHKTEVIIGELEKAEEDGLIQLGGASENGKGSKIEKLGLSLKEIDENARQEFQIDKTVDGVLISDIDPTSEAMKKGLKVGSIIVEINQQLVKTPKDVENIVKKASDNNRKSVLLLVNENGNARFVALKL